jgi:hypothetical protein
MNDTFEIGENFIHEKFHFGFSAFVAAHALVEGSLKREKNLFKVFFWSTEMSRLIESNIWLQRNRSFAYSPFSGFFQKQKKKNYLTVKK